VTHDILRLDGGSITVCIEIEPGRTPHWRHFGPRLGEIGILKRFSAVDTRSLPPASLDVVSGVPVLPCFGNESSRSPALRAHRSGHGAIQELVLERVEWLDDRAARLHLVDVPSALAARIDVSLDADCGVVTLRTELTNTGSAALTVGALAAGTVPMPARAREVGYFTGQWCHEYQWRREPIGAAGWRRENRRGRTSHDAPPVCFALGADTSDDAGEAVGCQLAWSGNHCFSLDRSDDGVLLLQAGEWFAPGEVILEPGASLRTPPLHIAWSNNGLDGVSSAFHALARRRVLRWPGGSMRPRPVHLNTWEAIYFQHDAQRLRELADHAAAVGIERFVLDDGWFEGRNDDRAGLGDWWPDPVKYPEGLGPLIAHVRGLGMEFGLWVEPEMVNPDSQLFRAHPDWVLQVKDRPLVLGRNQLVLDLSRPEVMDYLFTRLHGLLTQYPIAYFKWDMNRDLAQACGSTGRAAYRTQTLAVYELIGRLRRSHPDLEIESCASGAGRADLGILALAHRIWTSDNNDAVSRVEIQSGALRIFPPEVLGTHVGPAPAHSTGRTQSLDFRCAVASFGHMGVEADVVRMTVDERTTLAAWIAFHKQWRDVLHAGRVHQGSTASGLTWWLARTDQRALLAVIRTAPPPHAQEPPLRLGALLDTGSWRVRLARRVGHLRARDGSQAVWLSAVVAEGVVMTGDELAGIGLPVPAMHPESALIFVLESRPIARSDPRQSSASGSDPAGSP
jgi:alpha-galactosidase